MVVQMIAVGEQTGALDAMLGKIADFYDEEVDTAVANLTSLMEPMLMVFLGIVIGGVVIAMYLPDLQARDGRRKLGRPGLAPCGGRAARPPFPFREYQCPHRMNKGARPRPLPASLSS